ncbi:hypothetical protein CROQUDRAFT_36952 [Cronartium quercuum f. sp. fusiforme G11]|uniref:polynucleotide adenylyltransferase n=1 Tax=Cronartium quercuum f. sp. fusiforme G11 TaxID=708437 RepID=A0A9P6NXQ5_9BASI|nr:hypothetical protein CROQUDRAFT_36952 [Cronartium quercuum f. sp. fusiforme G11]
MTPTDHPSPLPVRRSKRLAQRSQQQIPSPAHHSPLTRTVPLGLGHKNAGLDSFSKYNKKKDSNWNSIKATLKSIKKSVLEHKAKNKANTPKAASKERKRRPKEEKKRAQMNTTSAQIPNPGPDVTSILPPPRIADLSQSQPPDIPNPKEFEGNVDFIKFDFSDHEEELDERKATDSHHAGNVSSNKPQGNKRKYAAGPGVTEAEANEVRKKKGITITPWFDTLQWKNRNVQQMLTAEISSFVAYIKPTQEEDNLRLMVIETIRRVVQSRYPDADVVPFGSFGTKLYLPGGDIDLVILSSRMMNEQRTKILYRLAPLIRENNIGQEVVVIAKAKVPIIKFKTIFGNFQVDISINQSNGLVALKTVNGLLDDLKYRSIDLQADQRAGQKSRSESKNGKGREQDESEIDESEEALSKVVEDLGAAKCMILVIKSVLKQRGMNEVYSGGLGSYSIICLVISFLQLHPKIQRGDIDPNKNLGVLLLEFLELYGKHYNFDETGISVRDGGYYFSKVRRGWQRERQPYLLSIEDPADESNDISGGSHNITGVRAVFAGAFDLLCATLYHRHSLQMSRADNISSRRLQTSRPLLAVPKPNQANEDDEDPLQDPMEQSLLGEIMGVTKELVENRKKNLKLYYSGTLQRILKMPPPPSPDQPSTRTNERVSKSAQAVEGKSKGKQKRNKKKGKEKQTDDAEHQDETEDIDRNSMKISRIQARRNGSRDHDTVEDLLSLSSRTGNATPFPASHSPRIKAQYPEHDFIALDDDDSQLGNRKEKGRQMDESTRSVAWVVDTQPGLITYPESSRGMSGHVKLDLPDSLVMNLAVSKCKTSGRGAEDDNEDSRYNISRPTKSKRARHHIERFSRNDQFQNEDFTVSRSSSPSSSHSLASLKEKQASHPAKSYCDDGASDESSATNNDLEGYLRGPGTSEQAPTTQLPRPDMNIQSRTLRPLSPGTPCDTPPSFSYTPATRALGMLPNVPHRISIDPNFSPGTPAGTPPSTARLSHGARQQMWLSKGGLTE